MNGLNIYETGLFWIPNEIILLARKINTTKSRQIVEAHDDEVFINGNVPQTASQSADTNSSSIYFYNECDENDYYVRFAQLCSAPRY